MGMVKLTKKQIKRQDFVDNAIFELIQKLLPADKKLKWDIGGIGAVRDAIQARIVDERKLMSEAEFYSYLKT
jgi:hypothetical protein